MRLEIKFDNTEIHRVVYHDYCKNLYHQVLDTIKDNIREIKYKVREHQILDSDIINWNGDKPTSIDLVYYVLNCLELYKDKDTYYIGLSKDAVVEGSTTKVSYLIRVLEFGTKDIQAYPFIRSILLDYSNNYKNLFFKLR